jgi:hypothetical protein
MRPAGDVRERKSVPRAGRTAFGGELVAKHPRDLAVRDLGDGRVACLKDFARRFVKHDVIRMDTELQRNASQRLVGKRLERRLDAILLRGFLATGYCQTGYPFRRYAQLPVAH